MPNRLLQFVRAAAVTICGEDSGIDQTIVSIRWGCVIDDAGYFLPDDGVKMRRTEVRPMRRRREISDLLIPARRSLRT